MSSSVERLNDIKDFGIVMAESFKTFFEQPASRSLIEEFKRAGVNMIEHHEVTSGPLDGKEICFYRRTAGNSETSGQGVVLRAGGEVVSSVSKNVDYLVVGSSPGSKFDQARELGVETINIEQFREMVHG
jgi:DNA ligase (NAD+)